MYKHLTQAQRYYIYVERQKGSTQKSIAQAIGVSEATVSREIRRNGGKSGSYNFIKAQEKAEVRSHRSPGNRAISDTLKEILGAIKWVLGRIPPELAADILQNGIFLTGGSAALPNLDSLIAAEFGVPVSVARDAGECTTLGAGYLADHYDMLGNMNRNDSC